jgi:hypothetical protein
MSLTNGTARRRSPPADLDGLITHIAESMYTASEVEDRGWRRTGSKVQSERTLADLEEARTFSRQLLEGAPDDDGNEFALGAAENRCNYAVGDAGLVYEAIPARGQAADPGVLRAAQEFVDLFHEANDLPAVEWETVWRFDRDGDTGLRLFPGNGVPDLRFVAGDRIAPPEPGSPRPDILMDPDDSWGVVHPLGDRGRKLGYWVSDGPGMPPKFVPESEMVLFKVNTDSDCPRGWPTWEPIIKALRRAEELNVAMTSCGIARAKIAIITKAKGLTQEKADRIAARLTQRTIIDGSGLSRVDLIEQLPYGSRIRIGADDTWEMPNHALGAADLQVASVANLTAGAVRTNMPKWMFTGEAAEKYANAFVAEATALRSFKRIQRILVQGFGAGRLRERASVVWRAIRMGVRAGLLPPQTLTTVQIKATPPSLETRDKNAEASANVAYIGAGVKPVPQVQKELGLDPAEMKKLAEKYPAPAAPPAAPPGPGARPTGATPAAEGLRVEPVAEGGPAASGGTFPAPGWE